MSGSECNMNNCGENVFMGDDTDDIDEEMPFELLKHAREAVLEILPEQSRQKYNRTYKNFKDWQSQNGTATISNQLVLAYFHMLATTKKYKATSLWAYHSMLKATISTFEDTDIGKFAQVTAFLKAKSSGYRAVKARVFSEENIKTFIDEADDLSWLDVKVIFGLCGALRIDEFTRITLEDLEKHGDLFLVKIHKTKTKLPRSFAINGGFGDIVRKFIELRPVIRLPTDRLFTNYQRGKCTKQFIGKNKFSMMPRRIAQFLSLPEPERYTGHSFRRTSATFLANSGADIETIKRHGGWRNESCAKAYIEDSLGYKARTGDMIQRAIFGIVIPSTTGGIAIPSISGGIVVPSTSDSIESSRVRSTLFLAPTDAPANKSAAESLIQNNDESFFDSLINNEELVEIVDRVSQSHQQSTQMLVAKNVGVCAIGDAIRETIDEGTTARSAVLTQSSMNSSLKAILSRSFKSVNFEGTGDNCVFNFNFSK